MQKPGLFGMNGFIVFLLTCFSFAARAQQAGYLILIDAENKQAFTIRIGDQFFTSSVHGHLVLSHLSDSSYRLNLSFPKKNLAEQVFPVVIRQKDRGFQLRGGDSSWVLYNWQTKETIRPVNEKDSSRILEMGMRREDGFSRLMASVVNDSSVMYNTYKGNGFNRDSSTLAVRRLPKDSAQTTSSIPPSVLAKAPADKPSAIIRKLPAKDSLIAVNSMPPPAPAKVPAIKSSAVIRQPSTFNPGVKKLREVSLRISRKMVFLDVGKDGQSDTITLFVYFESADTILQKQIVPPAPEVKRSKKTDSAVLNPVVTRSNPVLKSSEPGCSQLATDADAEFLRSAILKANGQQEKIALANSAFEMKCFSVSQVRMLAGLFVSDKDKYRLMDAAHLHIADHEHFHELVDMLTDKNFQRKFLVMADKRS